MPAHLPAGLIRCHHRGGSEVLDQGVIGRLCLVGHAFHRTPRPRARDLDAEAALHRPGGLLKGQAETLVELGNHCGGARPELGGGGTGGIGTLAGIAPGHACPAVSAAALLDVEADGVRLDRGDLGVELVGLTGGLDVTLAVRAPGWQRDGNNLVDRLRWCPPRLSPVVLAGLATGLLGVGLGRPLREGRRLALSRPASGLELGSQARVLGAQPGGVFGPGGKLVLSARRARCLARRAS